MRKVILNLTTSLDGFIADRNGGIDWLLPMPEEVPPDYHEHMATVDTLIMGRVTYETSLGLKGGPGIFEGKKVFVFTQRKDFRPLPEVTLIHASAERFVAALKEEVGGTIWLFGGGQLATALSDAGLIDEYLIAVQPILLGDGIPLWRVPHGSTRLDPTMARMWTDGIVELRYRRSGQPAKK